MEKYFQGTFYNSEKLAPVVLFVYNRPEHTRKTLEALSQNTLADKSKLFVFADGAKENATQETLAKIAETRAVVKEKNWCGSVTVFEQEKNRGLAASIISGVTEIANQYGSVIVLEDDIVTGKYFLEYMNNALELYKNEKKVWHITGWRDPVKNADSDCSFFYPNMDCWGWATWADRWQNFKKDAAYYKSIFTEEMIYRFNMDGAEPGNWQQIEDNISGKINTWAIFWYATIFLQNGLCLAPTKSLVKNIGFDNTGVHCGENPMQIIKDSVDGKIEKFPKTFEVDKKEFDKNKKFIKMMRNGGSAMNETLKSILRPPYRVAKKVWKKLFAPKPLGYIFMLHRVSDWESGKLFSNENMKVSPNFLNEQLTKITEKFDVIKLTDVPKYLAKKQSKKFAVFTMDDGYKDNLTNALPVFKKHNVPFTIFVTTDFPDKKAVLWWYLLEDLILSHDEIVLSNGITYPCKTKEEKEKSFLDIRMEILNLDQKNLENELNVLFKNYKINWLSKCDGLCLSWNDIAVLKNEPLVEIAAHTQHHYNLKQLENEDAVCEEITAGIERLKNDAGIMPSTFAYPFGSTNEIGQREFDCMKKISGINLACIAYGGACNRKNTKNIFALPRVMFTMDFNVEKL